MYQTGFYIDGQWVTPDGRASLPVINPATAQQVTQILLGTKEDVDRAVQAARRAFGDFSRWSRRDRIRLLERIGTLYQRRMPDIAQAISTEMGAPMSMALPMQAGIGVGHVQAAIEVLQEYEFETAVSRSVVRREPIGVCALITPWNWPVNQMLCKVLPALAAGCTVVLKPSEVAPLSAALIAAVLHEAGVPPGVFNLIQGDGPTVGSALSAHPQVDMVSFTGSGRAGAQVARDAAETVKRVCQELGGKSASVILPAADLDAAVRATVQGCLINSGQTCKAPTRLLVPAARQAEAVQIACEVMNGYRVGDPAQEQTQMGPLASAAQYDKVQAMIALGVAEGATLACGGLGRPTGLTQGFYARPTLFSDVSNRMRIAREEIFGPVLCMLPYESVEQAIEIANDSPFGLSGAVWGATLDEAAAVARQLRTGNVHLNGAGSDLMAPFGGYKQSGNGREWGLHGFEEFLETKAIIGLTQPAWDL